MLDEQTPEFDSLNCFMFKFARTFNPLDDFQDGSPIEAKSYLRDFNRCWLARRYLAIPKSRQIMGTWWGVIVYTWDAIKHPKRITLFKSIDKKHAGWGQLYLLWRAQYIVEHLPECIRPRIKPHKKDFVLEFPENGSTIEAVSMEARDPRTLTATGVLDDETAIQQYAEAGWASLQPLLGVIGRYTAISTYLGLNWFYRTVHDVEL
jgi:hypothetical protein